MIINDSVRLLARGRPLDIDNLRSSVKRVIVGKPADGPT